jgi:hypothetical protein
MAALAPEIMKTHSYVIGGKARRKETTRKPSLG